jgi:hypothetical protein
MRCRVGATSSLKESILKSPGRTHADIGRPREEKKKKGKEGVLVTCPSWAVLLPIYAMYHVCPSLHARGGIHTTTVLLLEAFGIFVDAAIDVLGDAWINLVMSLFIALE